MFLSLYNKIEFFSSHIELLFVPISWLLCFFVGIIGSSIYAILGLILLFLLAGSIFIFYFKLSFLGVLLIIIYIGALAVLFLFIVMMLPIEEEGRFTQTKNIFFYFIFFIFFLITILWLFAGFILISIDYSNYEVFDETILKYELGEIQQIINDSHKITWQDIINNDIRIVGEVLYSKFSLPLILCSLLLFYALVVAIIFSQDL